jgi:solute carrier family 25 (mitochondrial phosphate transporter), member 3
VVLEAVVSENLHDADMRSTRVPYTMSKFVVYEKVAEAIYRRVDKNTASDGTKTVINLGSGLIAGFAAAIVSQPADTMLSKINKTKGLPGEGTTSRLFKIAGELGFRGSFAGLGARLFMVGTLTAGQFAIYGGMYWKRNLHKLNMIQMKTTERKMY